MSFRSISPFPATGGVTGMASCATNLYAVGEARMVIFIQFSSLFLTFGLTSPIFIGLWVLLDLLSIAFMS